MIPLGMFAASGSGLLVDEGFDLDQPYLYTVGPGNIPWEFAGGAWSVSGGALCAPGSTFLGGVAVPPSRRTIRDGGLWRIEVDILAPQYSPRLAVGASLPGFPNDGVDVTLQSSSLEGYYEPRLRAWVADTEVPGTPRAANLLPPSRMALEVSGRGDPNYTAQVFYGESRVESYDGRAASPPTRNYTYFGTYIGLASSAPAGTPVFDNLKIWVD